MNRVKCAFCGKEYETESKGAKCTCGQRARLVRQRCVVCGKYRYSSSISPMCASCAQVVRNDLEARPMAIYVCRCGHEFNAFSKHAHKCPVCGLYVTRTRKTCCKCGKSFAGGRTTNQCPDCADKQRMQTRFKTVYSPGYVQGGREPSPDQALAETLCAMAPKVVHSYIWQIVYRYPDAAKKIALEAKTESEAQCIIDAINALYLHERSSVGVASYGE